MTQSKLEFFRNGQGTQKQPDLVALFKRVEKASIQKWTPEQRRQAADWLNQVQRCFDNFKKDIVQAGF